MIEKEIDRIARIVKQMFNLSRPYQGKISEFNAISVIRDVITMLDKIGSEQCVTITFSGHEDMLKVTISEDHFRQLLYNIIKNGIEASSEGGSVEVRAKSMDSRLNVIVSDLGEGMSDDVRSKIFDPFFTTKSKYSDSGLGLGLATTKVIAEAMGGSLDCISEKDKGTAFTLDLPINLIH
ncbi:MAG: HAMP domain-containing histidine kinase, partial [Candidatus Scalindua sp.]|nr:HAMP domain-containing histidine kinase [Candidatus Scalindua sp.]